ncbi:glycosyltransferase family 4 protein [Treponema primitia]|uniref:glycosyltransferase family 4 protein n=1 Tax=Treponema primitia TaxID=88058 RepID=UPI0006856B7C|nr:glycosyltransferase family 4 protein [Treponema primitia]
MFYIDGVGVDFSRFHPVSEIEKYQLRKQLGYNAKDFIILYIAEFIPRKNHIYLLRQIPRLRESVPNLKIVFAGKGKLLDACKKTVEKLDAKEIVDFLGYRNDIDILCQIADIHIAISKQEGLGVNNIEAMASGLPIICSKIRGHIDVVTNGRNGLLFELFNPKKMVNSIITLYSNPVLRKHIAQNNVLDAQKYSINTAISNMAEIYQKFMEEG